MIAETNTMIINGQQVEIENEKNLLEVIRKSGIELLTFCYHSDLSVYGACRLCMVDVEGQGLLASCSVKPSPGMVVKTATQEIREIRKIAVELLLANHNVECPTCHKSSSCKLEELSRKLGITDVRFKKAVKKAGKDFSSPSIIRDPEKCVLCGDCVRYCTEIQGVGAIDFAYRGKNTIVTPAFNRNIDQVECVNCGQCRVVCPVGAISIKPEIDEVFKALDDSQKTVVAQIAPAVRVAMGEYFKMDSGEIVTGKIVSALKKMGFSKVFDTSFSADLTVMEEGTEFLDRLQKGEKLPQFTSCCPAWVKFAEQYYPDILNNLSSCKSPQQMFGSLARKLLPKMLDIKPENLVVVSIMPCTAKKYEAKRPEFSKDAVKDVDNVITTQELGIMIEASGLNFESLKPESFDLPMGFKTGAGVIFGASGGVTEAVLRFVVEKAEGKKLENFEFKQVRGFEGLREATLEVNGSPVRLAVVNGLNEAKKLVKKICDKEVNYDIVEVMACPGGCVGGAGQPVNFLRECLSKRASGLYEADKMSQLHKSQDNPYIDEVYSTHLQSPGSKKAHDLLHTNYYSKSRISKKGMPLITGESEDKLEIKICVGTNCFTNGSQKLLMLLSDHVQNSALSDAVDLQATFCLEKCGQAPNVMIGDTHIAKCTFEKAVETINSKLSGASFNSGKKNQNNIEA